MRLPCQTGFTLERGFRCVASDDTSVMIYDTCQKHNGGVRIDALWVCKGIPLSGGRGVSRCAFLHDKMEPRFIVCLWSRDLGLRLRCATVFWRRKRRIGEGRGNTSGFHPLTRSTSPTVTLWIGAGKGTGRRKVPSPKAKSQKARY